MFIFISSSFFSVVVDVGKVTSIATVVIHFESVTGEHFVGKHRKHRVGHSILIENMASYWQSLKKPLTSNGFMNTKMYSSTITNS